jgi:hypothetical protein
MKTIIAAATFATLIASPAFAQSYDPSVGSGNIAPKVQVQAPTLQMKLQAAQGAYAQVQNGGSAVVQFSGNGAADPDANIRFQLNRETLEGRW